MASAERLAQICRSKVRYAKRWRAKRAAHVATVRYEKRFRAYECPICEGFHLTSNPRRKPMKIRIASLEVEASGDIPAGIVTDILGALTAVAAGDDNQPDGSKQEAPSASTAERSAGAAAALSGPPGQSSARPGRVLLGPNRPPKAVGKKPAKEPARRR